MSGTLDPVVDAAAKALVNWAIWQTRMMDIALRPWAVINNVRVPDDDVLWHRPDGLTIPRT